MYSLRYGSVRCWFKALAACLALEILWAAGAESLRAQERAAPGVFLPTGNEFEILWQRMERWREAQDWDAVVEGLTRFRELLKQPEVNFVVRSGGRLSRGIRDLVSGIAASLPEAERERYANRLDAFLKDALEEASFSGPEERARTRHRILRDHAGTTIHAPLLGEEIDEAFERGQSARARSACRELLQMSESAAARGKSQGTAKATDGAAPAEVVRARLVLAEICRAEGDLEGLRAQAEALRRLRSEGKIAPEDEALGRWTDKVLEAPPSIERPAPTHRSAMGRRQASALEPMVPSRGSMAGLQGEAYRLGSVVWQLPVAGSRLRQFVTERSRYSRWSAVALPFHPVARDGWIFFQHSGLLVAYDARLGREAWKAPLVLGSGEDDFGEVRSPLVGTDACFVTRGSTIHAVRKADGKAIWEKDFEYDPAAKTLDIGLPDQLPRAEEIAPVPVPAPVEGEEGDADGKEDEKPKKMPSREAPPPTPWCSLSPPIFLEDDVLLAVTVRVDRESLYYLTRLRQDGSPVWTTFIGSSQGGDYLALGGAGSIPLVKGTDVFHLTNAGFLAAMDGVDGTIRWISEYPALASRSKEEAIRKDDRWQANPILAVGGSLIVAPRDSACLLALREADGDVDWVAPREGGSALAGADERACFVVGKEVVAVLHSGERRGQAAWKFELEKAIPGTPAGHREALGLQPFGRPLLLADVLLIPCRMALLSLSARDGRLLNRTLWEFAGGSGNIVLSGDSLGVIHPEGMAVYSHRTAEKATLDALARDDPASLLDKARFHLKNFEVSAGLQALREWELTAPPAPVPNSRLDILHLDLAEMCRQLAGAEEAKPHDLDLLRFRVPLERTPERRVEAAIDLASELEKAGDVPGALEALHSALSHDNPETEYSPDGITHLPSAAYIKDKIKSLRASVTNPETLFAKIHADALAALKEARKQGSPTAFLDVLRLYPLTPAAARAYLDLHSCYRDRKSNDQALRALEGRLEDFPGDADVAKVKLMAANLLYQLGRRKEAKQAYLELLKAHPDATLEGLEDARPGETIVQYVGSILDDPGLRETPEEAPPTLRFPIRMAWRSPADLQTNNRSFLHPSGSPPEALQDCFLTQSVEVVECRQVETGLPVWSVQLELIPGFQLSDSAFGFRFPRTGSRSISGKYVEGLLVLSDEWNLFAVDSTRGTVKWHRPFGLEADAKEDGGDALRLLKERLRAVLVTEDGIFATSSGRSLKPRIRRFSLEGELVWERELSYEPASYTPSRVAGTLFVHSQSPSGVVLHDAETGRETGRLGANDGLERLVARPVEPTPERLLLPCATEVKLLNLRERKFEWTFKKPRTLIEDVAFFPRFPEECILFVDRPNSWPAMICLSLRDGTERWRYEKFPARQTSFSVFREADRFYVIHGDDRWNLLALQVNRTDESGRPIVEPLWTSEVVLGTFLSGSTQRKLHVGGDSLFFPDPTNAISVYDKLQGTNKNASAAAISKFLVEKGAFASEILQGKLVLLTDAGDCAFETASIGPRGGDGASDPKLLREYLSSPALARPNIELALQCFKQGQAETAVNLLDRALLSETILEKGSEKDRMLLGFLLEGIREESMKQSVPRITSHATRQPPVIDGELNDPWDVNTRIHINLPSNVARIPGFSETSQWDGEEDLSAILYTGWDEEYFYFVLDVTDDALHPYDRDAENWKGDCLLIGLDPTGDGGYRQHGGDQLMTLALTVPKRNKLDKDKKDGPSEEEEEEEEDQKPDGLFSVKKKEDDSGVIYEVALPWTSFSSEFEAGVSPEAGFSFGLSLLLTDDDTGQGATKTLSLNPCHLLPKSQKNARVWRFIVPYFFPRVTLE